MNNLIRIFEQSSSAREYAEKYAKYLSQVLSQMDFGPLDNAVKVLEKARGVGRTIFFAGNGGSAATSSHWAEDLTLGTRKDGARPYRSISLSDGNPMITALGNDREYADIFVGQLEALFEAGDVLVAISASGNSPNVIRAVEYVNNHGGTTIGLCGFDGGKLRTLSHIPIWVSTPPKEYGPVEDVHMILDHVITTYLRSMIHAHA